MMFSIGRASALGCMLIVAGIMAEISTDTNQPNGGNGTNVTTSSNSTPADSSIEVISSTATTLLSVPTALSESSAPTPDLLQATPSTSVVDTASVTQSSDVIEPTSSVTEPPSTLAPEESSVYSVSVTIDPSATVTESSQSLFFPDDDANTTATSQAPADSQPASGGGGDSSDGELSTGGKVAIGIFVSLAIVALVVGGVCFYQRNNDPKGTLKNLVNPGIQYRSFDSTGGKEEEKKDFQ